MCKCVSLFVMDSKHKHNAHVMPVGLPLMGEGVAMLLCLIPSLLSGDDTILGMAVAGCLTFLVGLLLFCFTKGFFARHFASSDTRQSYVAVALVWILLSLFGSLPFLFTGSTGSFTDAFFESMSGLTSTGATIFSDVNSLPSSVLLWRSVSQWFGGFGIILLVLAVVPTLHINKHSLYTAEASGADNTAKSTTSMRVMIRHTLSIYVSLTLFFVVMLWLSGMTLWEAVNLTFTNISTGGFSIYSDSISRFSPLQQYLLAASMFVGGINFALLYNIFTFKWSRLKHKLDQFAFYVAMAVVSILFVVAVLHWHDGYGWNDAARYATVQTISVLTTTGSVVADTTVWWSPVLLLFLMLCFCGGMAGSTSGGIKVMRVLILFRNVGNSLANRLHPHAYNPVRLNGSPVSESMITNVMVIFFVFCATILIALLSLLVCGVNATEALGAVFGCITGYGPGLGASGGFGSYSAFPMAAKWICCILMLLGRLECITLFILFLPGFWKR